MSSTAQPTEPQDSHTLIPPLNNTSQPKTPVVEHASLPDIPSATGPAVPLQTPVASKPQPAPPIAGSMTPPPSTQLPTAEPPKSRTPPVQSNSTLSSPPPTQKVDELSRLSDTINVTDEQILAADPSQLRVMATELAKALKEARASVAHHKLQSRMANLENDETANRMSVELFMAQREVEVLQLNEARLREASAMNTPNWGQSNPSLFDADQVNAIIRKTRELETDNRQLQHMLQQATEMMTDQEGKISSLKEQNVQLRERIRENRDHINSMRRNNILGIYTETPPRTGGPSTPFPQTPNARYITDTPSSRPPTKIDTLLLADQHLKARSRGGHARNAHSVSSIPSTPSHAPRSATASNIAAFRTPQAPPKAAATISAPHTAPVSRYRPDANRARDRNIRAASEETIPESDDERTNPDLSDDDQIPESQASRSATDLLRRSMTSSQGEKGGDVAKQGSFQTKMKSYAKVTKPGVKVTIGEKRKGMGEDDGVVRESKKGRTGSIGLGIEGWHGAQRS
ncbi:MAG: hypothetical protein M1820_010715 [Bogoriella megaspora]|nr:MAG: hypothetical protein M1820_010715 [Bogoriella megaspora]